MKAKGATHDRQRRDSSTAVHPPSHWPAPAPALREPVVLEVWRRPAEDTRAATTQPGELRRCSWCREEVWLAVQAAQLVARAGERSGETATSDGSLPSRLRLLHHLALDQVSRRQLSELLHLL